MEGAVNLMLKKIDWSRQFVQEKLHLLACPYCRSPFATVSGYSLVCVNQHRFDLSKKGTLYLFKQKATDDYTQELFMHRYQLAQSGFFVPLLEQVKTWMIEKEEYLVVDIGCGEGSSLAWLTSFLEQSAAIGVDIAKQGIQTASLHFPRKALWMVADLARLPFATSSCATLINMLTPSNYQEFNRVLIPGGRLIKIIPGTDYLIELRKQLYNIRKERQHYSNEDILNRFKAEYPNMQMQEIRYTVDVTEETYDHLLQMTPLYWGANAEDRLFSQHHPLKTVTVHLWILVAEK